MTRKFALYIIGIVSVVIIVTGFVMCSKTDQGGYNSTDGAIWHTTYHIVWRGNPELRDSILPVLNEVGRHLSVFDANSEVSAVNAGMVTANVSEDFKRVYLAAKSVNEASGGIFDPTLSPLIDAWGFGRGHKASADTAKIELLWSRVGMDKTSLANDTLYKQRRDIEFNFSALAKGYGCDRVGDMFRRNSVNDFIVEIGGEIYASGTNPDGKKWGVSIDKPIYSDSAIVHDSEMIIEISNMGMATSGNYRNCHTDGNGRRYGHILSPKTGRPALTDVLSATVLAPDAMTADAWATTFMAMPPDVSMVIADKMGFPVMLITADSLLMNKKFKELKR